jgi:hypothetical protein
MRSTQRKFASGPGLSTGSVDAGWRHVLQVGAILIRLLVGGASRKEVGIIRARGFERRLEGWTRDARRVTFLK